MRKTILSLFKRIFKRLRSTSKYKEHIKKLYEEKDYLEAYSEHTNLRVECSPHKAIGGRWEMMGNLQFDFLVKNGLEPQHIMLDIGCGTLRGGRHFIRYLNTGNYSGIDISHKAIEYGKQLVQEESLLDKHPRLLVSKNKDLNFAEFDGEIFDYLLAQSVFTHLKPEHIEECFQHIGHIMKLDSVFFFTFNKAFKFKQTSLKGFRYPFSFFESLADRYGFRLEDYSNEYKHHPTGQHVVKMIKK